MVNAPSNWECTDPGHLNADGASIEFKHTEKELHAIIESGDEFFSNQEIGYYTVIFDDSTSNPREKVEDHVFFDDEDKAKDYLEQLLEKHN